MYNELRSKEKIIGVVGLGYVGLPIALELAKDFKVIGFDINRERVEMMNKNQDPSMEIDSSKFEGKSIEFTSEIADIKNASFYIITVPTPIDEHNNPDLKALFSASELVGKVMNQGDYVVFESTVYPGCTEEDCVPILENESGLKYQEDFKVGYSPERINPGDKQHTLRDIKKIVSGCDDESLKQISKLYSSIIDAGIFEASSIKVAEAAKVIENTQRDLNIALMNELSIIFNKMNINTFEVIDAASTKWNFLPFTPGLVGGHCIGVDPYYLTFKANELGCHSKVILGGRTINDSMGALIAKEVTKYLVKEQKSLNDCKVLVLGATFKENVADIRNSKVIDLIKELKSFQINTEIHDPHASSEELYREYGLELNKEIGQGYDAVILSVPHDEYLQFDEQYFQNISNNAPLLFDLKGVFRGQFKEVTYWSL